MASNVFTVTYADGKEITTRITMGDMCAAEQALAREGLTMDDAKITGMMRAVYHRLRKDDVEDEPFETWADRIVGFDVPDDEETQSFTAA